MYHSDSSSLSQCNLQIIESDPNHVLFSHGNVLVSIWFGAQEPEVVRRLYGLAVTLAKQCKTGKVAALSVLMQGTSVPSPATRDALARMHEDPQQVIHRSALVFARSGFVASIIRSVVISVRQRASRRDGHDVFSNTAEALNWVTQSLPTPDNGPVAIGEILAEIERQCDRSSLVA